MKRLTLAALLLASCTSAGGAPVVARVEAQGAATVAFDLNSYLVLSESGGFAQLRDTNGLPIYQVDFEPGVLIVGHLRDPKMRWTGDPGDPIPPDAWPWVLAVLTPAEISAMGLIAAPE